MDKRKAEEIARRHAEDVAAFTKALKEVEKNICPTCGKLRESK